MTNIAHGIDGPFIDDFPIQTSMMVINVIVNL